MAPIAAIGNADLSIILLYNNYACLPCKRLILEYII